MVVWEMVKQAINELGGNTTSKDIKDWILKKYPDTNKGTINCQILVYTVNSKTRTNYSFNKVPRIANMKYDFLYSSGRGQIETYDHKKHGLWEIYKKIDGRMDVRIVGQDFERKIHQSSLPSVKPDRVKSSTETINSKNLSPDINALKYFLKSFVYNDIMFSNEAGLQHELGLFLRNRYKTSKIQFEKNIVNLGLSKKNFIKKEIDIAIFSQNMEPLAVIELKHPRNGQIPEQMFSFCKDIVFLEQLKKSGFKVGYFIALVEDKKFYQGKNVGIYDFFRENGKELTGKIRKPTGTKDEIIEITGKYNVKWEAINKDMKYFIIEI